MSDKILAISAIVLVAVIMGFSAVAPMIPQAEAIPGQACDGIKTAAEKIQAAGGTVPPKLAALVAHCNAYA